MSFFKLDNERAIHQQAKRADLKTEEEMTEACEFFGWAIFSLRKTLANERDRAMELEWTLTKEVQPILDFVDSMRCFHHEVICDKECMSKHYSNVTLVNNRGWLALVQKECIRMGWHLLKLCRGKIRQTD